MTKARAGQAGDLAVKGILQHAADEHADGGAHLPLLWHLAEDLLQVEAPPGGLTVMPVCAIDPARRSGHRGQRRLRWSARFCTSDSTITSAPGRIADYLRRFHQVSVARSTVHRLLGKHGVARLPANQKHRPHRHSGGSAMKSRSQAIVCRWM